MTGAVHCGVSRVSPEVARTRSIAIVSQAVDALLASHERVVLAVSGGVDSMVLLHAAASRTPDGYRLVVATFDHGTGPTATRAATLVRDTARSLGLVVHHARSNDVLVGERAWREARWRFLSRIASQEAAPVVTAHTRDDQLETIAMRILRDAGVRGLAALGANSTILRPFLDITRQQVVDAAGAMGVSWMEDPSNASRAHLRNRVRLDLLPALLQVRPRFAEALLELSQRAAQVRLTGERLASGFVTTHAAGRIEAATNPGGTDDPRALGFYWQSVAGLVGLALDWRGTRRLARLAQDGRVGARIQLSGGWEGVHRAGTIELRRRARVPESLPFVGDTEVRFGRWRFLPVEASTIREGSDDDPWVASLPVGGRLEVRSWNAGDRLRVREDAPGRRVKRFFSDRRIISADREGWPVVVADGEIVWIPGIRRGFAAAARPGRPYVRVVCERNHG